MLTDLGKYRPARAAINNLLSDYNLIIRTIRQQNKRTKGCQIEFCDLGWIAMPPLDITAGECQKKGSPSLNGPLSLLIF